MKHLAATQTTSSKAAELLDPVPSAGGGVHNWLFRAARRLHGHLQPGEIVSLLREQAARCGRRVPQREIVAAVRNSERCARRPAQGQSGVPFPVLPSAGLPITASPNGFGTGNGNGTETGTGVRVPVDHALRECIVSGGIGLADLWEVSPVRMDAREPLTEWILDLFFPGNPLLCCGSGPARFDTRSREDWRGQLADLGLIVPSAMSAVTGMTQDGRPSRHTLDNTGPRRFLVCEFDQGGCDEHAALLWHLNKTAPLVCAVHSGGKSLHGWFFVQYLGEDSARRFFREAVRVGADPATWTRSQFVRMPDGRRDNGKIQTVFYLNPKPLFLRQVLECGAEAQRRHRFQLQHARRVLEPRTPSHTPRESGDPRRTPKASPQTNASPSTAPVHLLNFYENKHNNNNIGRS